MNWSEENISGQSILKTESRRPLSESDWTEIWSVFIQRVVPYYEIRDLSSVRVEFWGDSGNIMICPFQEGQEHLPLAVMVIQDVQYAEFVSARVHADREIEEVQPEIDDYERRIWSELTLTAKEVGLSKRMGVARVVLNRVIPQDSEVLATFET